MAFIQFTSVRSNVINRKVTFNAIVPFDNRPNETPMTEFKTLYMLHGLRDNNTIWLLNTRIAEIAEKLRIAVIFPSGENSYYLPKYNCFEDWDEFIGSELIELTRRSLPLSHKREDTWIGGFSMGGYGALRNGLKYNEVFSKIITFAPSLELEMMGLREDGTFAMTKEYLMSHYGPDLEAAKESDKNPLWLIDKMAKEGKRFPEIYMSTGASDDLMLAHNRIADKLSANNIPFTSLTEEGVHDWDFINRQLDRAMDWLVK